MIDAPDYCRALEAYLCKKNEGHLIRIVGPVFEQVAGWAAQGVPLDVAFRGIDRYCERYYAKGPRRRPVRVEFCEADILEEFDSWRRAVGVSPLESGRQPSEAGSNRDSLPAHLDRLIARLTAVRTSDRSPAFREQVELAVRELDSLRATAKQARGEARAAMVSRLAGLDARLLEAARAELDDVTRDRLRAQAESEVAPFAGRMTAGPRAAAIGRALDRLVRNVSGLPVVVFEP